MHAKARRTIGKGVLTSGVLLLAVAARAVGPVAASGGADTIGNQRHLVLMLVYAAVALFFSFLCSVAEAVVLSVSPSYIAHLVSEGRKSARLLERIKHDIDRSLAAILTLNTIAHTVGAGGAGAEAAAYFGDRYVGIAMAVLTLLILFLSEIIPKTVGALYWRRLAPAAARFVQILIWGLFPLIVVSERLTKLLTRGKTVHRFNREEFEALADIGEEGGQLDARESRILRNLFRFPNLRARDVMTPRTVVFALQQDMTVAEALDKHADMPFTRIPIYGENRDDVKGFVLKTDILLHQHREQSDLRLRMLRRDLHAVVETAPLSPVLEALLDYRAHILLVVDEYGGMGGVVTLEDVVETLIGIEIVDEADKIDDMRRLARERWEKRMKALGITPVIEPKPPSEEE
jgi:CBS domain containing-hemolysin-like protein